MAAAFSRRFPAAALLALARLATSGCSSLKFWDKDKGDKKAVSKNGAGLFKTCWPSGLAKSMTPYHG